MKKIIGFLLAFIMTFTIMACTIQIPRQAAVPDYQTLYADAVGLGYEGSFEDFLALLKDDIDNLRQQIADLRNLVESQDDRIAELENQVEKQGDRIAELEMMFRSKEWDKIVDNTINDFCQQSPNACFIILSIFRTSYLHDSEIVDESMGHGSTLHFSDEKLDILLDSKNRFDVIKTDESTYRFETKRDDGYSVWDLDNGWNWTPPDEWDMPESQNYPISRLTCEAKVKDDKITTFRVFYDDGILNTSYTIYFISEEILKIISEGYFPIPLL